MFSGHRLHRSPNSKSHYGNLRTTSKENCSQISRIFAVVNPRLTAGTDRATQCRGANRWLQIPGNGVNQLHCRQHSTRRPQSCGNSVSACNNTLSQNNVCDTPAYRLDYLQRSEIGLRRWEEGKWRRGRDSNPRDGCPSTPLAGERLRPLGHLSGNARVRIKASQFKAFFTPCHFFHRAWPRNFWKVKTGIER